VNDHVIDEIRSKLDIVDLVSEHVDLKRAGQNFKGLCPFHAEKTPSFMVNPAKQICYCFGCQKGGDIFSFTMLYENMNFQEAVSYLAEKSGIKIERTGKVSGYNKGIKESVLSIHKEAMEFFRSNLKSSGNANAYLSERGLTAEVIEQFSIGYSTDSRDSLFRHLKKQSFTPDQAKASGLVHFGEKGTHDFFRNRIMFPIFDLHGRPVAFGGRILSASADSPKYLNSPDHLLFKKGDSCYGLHIAKNSITQKGYTIVVEGYLDVIVCHQYGFSNTIAPLGTALTAGHLKTLKRFSPKVLLLFDGDQAGIAATRRSLHLVYAAAMTAKVLLLPTNEDPDTFLRKHGADRLRQFIGEAVTPVEFLLNLYGKNKLDAAREVLSLVLSSPDLLQRNESLRELSSWSGIDELTLRQELKLKEDKGIAGRREHEESGLQKYNSDVSKEEQILLSVILAVPGKSDDVLNGLDPERLGSFSMPGLFDKIRRFFAENNGRDLLSDKFMALCNSDEQSLITKLSVNAEVDPLHVDAIIKGCLRTLAMKSIQQQIEQAGKAGDEKLLFSLFERKKSLLKDVK
jgi:DNA primase